MQTITPLQSVVIDLLDKSETIKNAQDEWRTVPTSIHTITNAIRNEEAGTIIKMATCPKCETVTMPDEVDSSLKCTKCSSAIIATKPGAIVSPAHSRRGRRAGAGLPNFVLRNAQILKLLS